MAEIKDNQPKDSLQVRLLLSDSLHQIPHSCFREEQLVCTVNNMGQTNLLVLTINIYHLTLVDNKFPSHTNK